MRKTQLLGIALVVVCAFSAFVASSAFASLVTAKWLEAGTAITVSKAINTEGELLFENTLLGASILCSGLFEGTVGANGVDEVTAVFNLAGTKIAELDEEKGTGGISCTGVSTCETGTEIWPVNLPFKTQLFLEEPAGTFKDEAVENGNKLLPGYEILCLFLGASIDELCTAVKSTLGTVSNAATDVEGKGALSPLGTCNGDTLEGNIENNTGDIALTSLTNGAVLAASE